ncbi:hypothetical protein LWI28_004427 [Acer negundo]|uniref:Uncharacterized protein n=1 Tax=Acer negundo TaxID=4023 RepID=A0AAD5J3Q8_ACENE|nr:hypothetical protein LWI28_004427 [Acer negundo]
MNEEVKVPEVKNKVSVAESDPYGPWMQVLYGRNSRNHLGNNFTGKRNGYGGKSGNGDKHEMPDNGAKKPITNEGIRKGMDKEAIVDSNQVKASSSNVLIGISNRSPLNKNQLKPSASKYLVDSLSSKISFSKPSKENGNEVWVKRKSKGTKKIP